MKHTRKDKRAKRAGAKRRPPGQCFHRWVGNAFRWELCDRAACQRAYACRGTGPRRIEAAYPQMPAAAHLWFREILAAQRAGRRFDFSFEVFDPPEIPNGR